MSHPTPTLHMLCGKIASGKSTLAAKLSEQPKTVLISEDEWLGVLFSSEIRTLQDYVKYASKLKIVMGPHVSYLLMAGVSVVLDFPANTVENRSWMRDLVKGTGAGHQLNVLQATDEICLARLRGRNARGEHPFAATEEQFDRIGRHFVAPSTEEDLNITTHRQSK
ncbi:AAA family ATPase [Roseobacter sp.]|uniref:AAA family ATPase n=1 Tax=Roseobacter sp. TaxID=1907202 RepID=UPI00385EE3AB